MNGTRVDRRTVLVGGLATVALATSATGARKPVDPTVTCPAGRFRGSVESGIRVFHGIRYGNCERFHAPVAVAASSDVVRATQFGPSCLQTARAGAPATEDPLFLNIWSPDVAMGAHKPVMVYFHGGAYSSGTAVDPLLDGQSLAAAGDVVVVTVNHRLNAFGYLYLARLFPQLPDSGNAGQLDLILALKWVRENIAAFGGDPARVTVFGQSGGGAKIATLMGTAAAAGLFHRAITMSGQQVTASGPLNATSRARVFLENLGIKDANLPSLLSLPAERLVEALQTPDPIIAGNLNFSPVLDFKWLTRHPFWPDANPLSRNIPMILGNTRDETRAFMPPGSPKLTGLTWDSLPQLLEQEMRVDIQPEWVVRQYRNRYPTWTPREAFWGITTASRSWRGQVIEAEARALAESPTWVYQVNYSSPMDPDLGAPHTMDIPLAFGTLAAPGSFTGSDERARKASDAVMQTFVAFAATGDPKVAGQPPWPQYRLERRSTMVFDVESLIEDNPRQWERELFARVPYIQPGT